MNHTCTIQIEGTVQGVGFRHAAKEKFQELNLKGTVENNPDGSVTATFSGDPNSISAFIEWSKVGPPYASVTHVHILQQSPVEPSDKPEAVSTIEDIQ